LTGSAPPGYAHGSQELNEHEQKRFLKRYHELLEEQYPLQENGQILLLFPRLFMVAQRQP
jgi:trans-aconitate 2-methyltransferase